MEVDSRHVALNWIAALIPDGLLTDSERLRDIGETVSHSRVRGAALPAQ